MGFTLQVNPYLLLACIIMLAVAVYKHMTETYSYLQRLGIPCPKPVWVFGNTLEFKGKHVLDVFDAWRQIYGKVHGFYEGFQAGVVVNDPELAKGVLSRHFDKFYVRTSYRPFVYYPDDLRLISISGEHWKNQRVVLNKMLNSSATLTHVVRKVQLASKRMIAGLKKERQNCVEGLNISQFIDKFMSETVMRVVLDMNDDDIMQHGEVIHRYEVESNWSASAENEISGLARLFPALTPLLKLSDKKHKKAHEDVVKLLRDYLSSPIQTAEDDDVDEGEHTSLLSFLNASKVLSRDIGGGAAKRQLSTDETIAHILSMVSEIYSATTATLQFLLYELARNPECQQRLRQQTDTIYTESGEVCLNNVLNMDYFDKFFSETYRMHPVAPGLSRVCTEDCEIEGVQFRRGMVVRVMTSPIYSSPEYFPCPETFNPERFCRSKQEERHQYSFLPFGQGARMCPGQKLASIIMKTCVAGVLSSFNIQTSERTEVPLQTALRPQLCPKNGVHVTLTPRH